MRHRLKGRKLNVDSSHRKALLKNLVIALFERERIITTDQKSKEARRLAEKLITIAKLGDLHSRREAMKIINNKVAVKKLFENIAPRYRDRNGGYTRILKLGYRKGDNASLSLFELV
ncbi:MAG: 50S ribosomal protein L17 [Candidatus Firestonebacteria bacterium]|nr:50S ribosomal protein L17 [Candidatus Firestonebacteria bacterium]